MSLRNLLMGGIVCGCAFLASCSSSSDDDALLATQVADGTIPPWFAESDGGGYTDVTGGAPIEYKPSTAKSSTSTASRSKVTSKTKSSVKPKAKPKTRTYVVKKGDALEKIARRHGIKTSSLKKANNLKSDLIRPGQKLIIP